MSIGSATVRVTCDHCTRFDGNDAEVIELTALAHHGAWDDRNVKPGLVADGWEVDASGMCTCPECLAEEEADEEAETEE